MPTFAVRHLTVYRYSRPVTLGEHRMMFRPRDSYDQRLIEARLAIEPVPSDLRWLHDAFGNCVAVATFDTRATELRFESEIKLEHTPSRLPDLQIEPRVAAFPFSYDEDELPDLLPYISRRYPDSENEVRRWVNRFLRDGRPNETGALLMTLTAAIQESFAYIRRSEPGTQDPVLILKLGHGSCRDLALLMMEAVRELGMAARFASGYLYVPSRDSETMRGGGATHAWCQIYLPGAGWVEFDPTNGMVGSNNLIRVAVTRDPKQAIPLSGTWYGKPEECLEMSVEVIVRRGDGD